MNANYLAIVLWISTLLVQFAVYMWLTSKQNQRQRTLDEVKMAEISVLNNKLGQLKEDAIEHRLMTENIATYLEAKNGISFRRY